MNQFLTATVRDVNEQGAHLEIQGHTITWPLDRLPGGIRPGDSVVLRAMTEDEAAADYHERARAILRELLGNRP